MVYKQIDKQQGEEMAPFIWNVFLTKDPEFFVTPYGNRELRYRCYFDKKDKVIYLYLNKQEIAEIFPDGIPHFEEIYLYGAFNQVYIKQIKILVKISTINGTLKYLIRQIIRDRLRYGENEDDKLKLEPNKEDVIHALKSVKDGISIMFTPISYELGEYETG